jgi:hypothetical protein
MGSDQIQPERKQPWARSRFSGKSQIWAKLDFEFWHRCTVDDERSNQTTIVLDNLDTFTLENDRVVEITLEPGDLVFVQRWTYALGGHPCMIVSANREVATVDVFVPDGKQERERVLTREIRFYFELEPRLWKTGSRVYAYRPVDFTPPLFLMFPGTVKRIYFEQCAEVAFDDGTQALVPITLLEPLEARTGDTVYTCVSYTGLAITQEERWGPCQVLRHDGEMLLLADQGRIPFESHIGLTAILPRGYQMPNGKLERIPASSDSAASAAVSDEISRPGDVHIVRTDRWQEAGNNPISKADVDALIDADSDLAWMTDDRIVATRESGRVKPGHAIGWKGQICFWWTQNGITCTRPDSDQIAKMIEIAIALDANVIGHDGDVYH